MLRLLFQFVLFLMISLCSCYSETNKNIERFEDSLFNDIQWLTGTWTKFSGDTVLYEIWEKSGDSLFSGKSYMLIQDDTVFSEKISIVRKSNGIFYFASVLDQNLGEAISFKLIPGEVGVFVFENKDHDFPQRIIYQQIDQDSLLAKIEGTENGQFQFALFTMVRMK